MRQRAVQIPRWDHIWALSSTGSDLSAIIDIILVGQLVSIHMIHQRSIHLWVISLLENSVHESPPQYNLSYGKDADTDRAVNRPVRHRKMLTSSFAKPADLYGAKPGIEHAKNVAWYSWVTLEADRGLTDKTKMSIQKKHKKNRHPHKRFSSGGRTCETHACVQPCVFVGGYITLSCHFSYRLKKNSPFPSVQINSLLLRRKGSLTTPLCGETIAH